MNRDTLTHNFLNGQSVEDLLPLLAWGLIGMILSVLLDLIRNKDKIKRTGGFNFSFWFRDNVVRMIISLFIVFIGSVFTEELFQIQGGLGGLAAGFISDKVVEALIKFKNTVDVSKYLPKYFNH